MNPKVYVETTIISYLAASSSRDPVTAGRQLITERWWASRRPHYRLLISETVEAECLRGNLEMVERRKIFIAQASLFPLNDEIMTLAGLLTGPGLVPEKAASDAVHIAAAAVERCDYLLTWNFRHIANIRIRREVERMLVKHGYNGTLICTPEELI
jgi:hypothetical protein